MLFIFVLLFCAFFPLWGYEVTFQGIENPELLELVQSASQLNKLKNSPPSTVLGLRRRAEDDLSNIVHALHSKAFYDAKADFQIDPSGNFVKIDIQLGPLYPLAAFNIRYLQNGKELSAEELSEQLPWGISLEDLKVRIGEIALPEVILNAEELLLDKLYLKGFAFASIKKRQVSADQQAYHVIVWLEVDIGPLTYFGPIKMTGLERVKEAFFYRKLRWEPGTIYNPLALEATQEALELSGLFRSINITQGEKPAEDHFIPIEISVIEAKQRSVGFGLNYMTSLGPGISADWEDRNIFGEGQKLSFRSNVWQKLQEGTITYVIPDFGRQNQNLIWQVDFLHERTKSFTENTQSISGIIERKINQNLRFSYGGMYKKLRTQRSDFNGLFNLIKVPLHLRWSNADSVMEPTKGGTFQLKIVPSVQIFKPQFVYCINTMVGSFYQSLTQDKRHVFAVKLTLGSILGTSKHEIPPPERFYAGSESTLRGYRYLTVSPLNKHDKPIGGRSMLIYSMELRNRIGKNLGLTLFYDVGNVYADALPNFKTKVRQSAGIGVRYYTPIGPIRLDLAFPLNKRRVDNSLEAYFSIGQSF